MSDDQPSAAGEGGSRIRRLDLSHLTLLFVALAAVAGWAASFIGLHDFGVRDMLGFTDRTAWLIPAAFDGAAFACAVLTYRASIVGRAAVRGRLLTMAFTALSSWVNYIHQPPGNAKLVAVWLPIAAVLVFDTVLVDLRAEYEQRHGRRAFRLRTWLLLLRWFVDRAGTRTAFTDEVRKIQVSDLVGLGREQESFQAPVAAPEVPAAAIEAPSAPPQEPVLVQPEPEPVVLVASAIEAPVPSNVVTLSGPLEFEQRPEWVEADMNAKQAMFALLNRYPQASGSDLDRFGTQFFGTGKDYGRGVKREWIKKQQRPIAVNEG